jgi:hypothetical protein
MFDTATTFYSGFFTRFTGYPGGYGTTKRQSHTWLPNSKEFGVLGIEFKSNVLLPWIYMMHFLNLRRLTIAECSNVDDIVSKLTKRYLGRYLYMEHLALDFQNRYTLLTAPDACNPIKSVRVNTNSPPHRRLVKQRCSLRSIAPVRWR